MFGSDHFKLTEPLFPCAANVNGDSGIVNGIMNVLSANIFRDGATSETGLLFTSTIWTGDTDIVYPRPDFKYNWAFPDAISAGRSEGMVYVTMSLTGIKFLAQIEYVISLSSNVFNGYSDGKLKF